MKHRNPQSRHAKSGFAAYRPPAPDCDLLIAEHMAQENRKLVAGANAILKGNPACPKCSCGMVVRTGTYGAFWGCSQFPTCKGTRPQRTPAKSFGKGRKRFGFISG